MVHPTKDQMQSNPVKPENRGLQPGSKVKKYIHDHLKTPEPLRSQCKLCI